MRFTTILFSIVILLSMSSCASKSSKASKAKSLKEETFSAEKKLINFPSLDGLQITADYFEIDETKPLIVLCHQANWSRGEYQEIIPKLVALGYNCLAIDQRSGKEINGVINETAKLAKEQNKGMQYWDAEQDVVAAVRYANKKSKKVILWGSSYSASLVLKVAQEEEAVKRVLSFSPGEYFGDFLNLKESINQLNKPVFLTCSKDEIEKTQSIVDAIPSQNKLFFQPGTKGNHGSRALFERFADHEDYWEAVKRFLNN